MTKKDNIPIKAVLLKCIYDVMRKLHCYSRCKLHSSIKYGYHDDERKERLAWASRSVMVKATTTISFRKEIGKNLSSLNLKNVVLSLKNCRQPL